MYLDCMDVSFASGPSGEYPFNQYNIRTWPCYWASTAAVVLPAAAAAAVLHAAAVLMPCNLLIA